MDKLYPIHECPFCGGQEISVFETKNLIADKFWVVECAECWATGPAGITRPTAIFLWNSYTKLDRNKPSIIEVKNE